MMTGPEDDGDDDWVELPDNLYLRDLSERLMHVAAIHVDGYDIDRLIWIARKLEGKND